MRSWYCLLTGSTRSKKYEVLQCFTSSTSCDSQSKKTMNISKCILREQSVREIAFLKGRSELCQDLPKNYIRRNGLMNLRITFCLQRNQFATYYTSSDYVKGKPPGHLEILRSLQMRFLKKNHLQHMCPLWLFL